MIQDSAGIGSNQRDNWFIIKHSRDEVIERTVGEFERLDGLVAGLSDAAWALPLPRPETKDPWTVKDALAHITHWKADVVRSIRGQRWHRQRQSEAFVQVAQIQ